MRPGPRRVVPLVLAALGAWACTRNPYVIGTICPSAGADAGADPSCGAGPSKATLAVTLDRSGATALGALSLASGDVAPTLWLRGERATAAGWPSEGGAGAVLGLGVGVPAPNLGAPFSDGTGAVGLAADAPSYVASNAAVGAVGADDFALEVVLRAANGASVLDKRAGTAGWWLHEDAGGQLLLDLGDVDPTHAVTIAFRSLTPGAWYHCMFWVSHAAAQGVVDCNGVDQAPVTLPALGSLDVATPLAVGGGAASRVAHVELFRVQAGRLGDLASWIDVTRRRFAKLTGVYPEIAGGTRVPNAGLRDGEAYVDLQAATPGAPRRLFLVGAEWPRVACRADVKGAQVCGYLGEPSRSRVVPGAASAWQPAGLSIAPSTTPFPDGEPRFATLAASPVNGAHTLSFTATAGADQVLSFYARGLTTPARVGASAGALGQAVFDLSAGTVVSAPAGVTASIEPWGDGVFRCAYRFKTAGGPTTYTVHMLDAAGNDTFTGAGTASLEVAGLQVDVGLGHPGSLLATDIQPADQLTFAGDDGNLPASGGAVLATVDVLLPAGPIITDQAIFNINLNGKFGDQVQLYLRGDNSHVKFWALNGPVTYWAFELPQKQITDGARHTLQAGWDASSARLAVDDARASAMISTAPTAVLDHIDIGFSEMSSGALEGLVSGFRIGTP